MVCEYYSAVGGTGLACYCIQNSEQRAEIWVKKPTIPAASLAKHSKGAGDSVCYIGYIELDIFSLTEKARVRIAVEPPSSVKKKKKVFRDRLT